MFQSLNAWELHQIGLLLKVFLNSVMVSEEWVVCAIVEFSNMNSPLKVDDVSR
jgi:hypothetical protein